MSGAKTKLPPRRRLSPTGWSLSSPPLSHLYCPPLPAPTPSLPPFMEMACFRYGLTYPPEMREYPDHATWEGSLSDKEFKKLRNNLLDDESYVENSKELRRHLFNFVTPLSDAKANAGRPPPALWDLSPSHLSPSPEVTQARMSSPSMLRKPNATAFCFSYRLGISGRSGLCT